MGRVVEGPLTASVPSAPHRRWAPKGHRDHGNIGDHLTVQHPDLAGQLIGEVRVCVIMMMVAPAAFRSRMSSMIDAPVVLSRFPVGSSARTISLTY
jgi:hypothetical protein